MLIKIEKISNFIWIYEKRKFSECIPMVNKLLNFGKWPKILHLTYSPAISPRLEMYRGDRGLAFTHSNPMKSANQLRKIIDDYRQNAIFGGFPDDEKLGELIEEQTLNDPNAPPLAKFLCSMGTKGGAGIVAVARAWEFRDEVVEYQKTNNISSIYWNELDWKGEKVRFPISSHDLAFMPQDGPILTRWKYPTIDKFCDFVSRHNLEHLLYQSVWEDNEDDEREIPVTLPQIYAQAQHYAIAWLTGGYEKPVYHATEDESGIIRTSKEIAYYLSEYGLFLDPLPTPDDPDPDGIHFSVSVRRFG